MDLGCPASSILAGSLQHYRALSLPCRIQPSKHASIGSMDFDGPDVTHNWNSERMTALCFYGLLLVGVWHTCTKLLCTSALRSLPKA
eukprot:4896881-Amphidinium_carterae.1